MAIQPFGEISSEHIDTIVRSLERYHQVEVEVLTSVELPGQAYYKPRNRYRADSLIAWLRRNCPEGYSKVLGITTSDISTTKGEHADWGIFGLGYCPGKSCVVSGYRLKNEGNEKLKERLAKVAVHELGHTFGLPHCKADDRCVMNDACGTIKEVDENELMMCARCKGIKAVMGF